ncbi:MAG: hypothetical protein IPH00_07725 [Flavobacteriales bacterium]|nr:hypothetical protein [Flavobacteriales bacterium]
MSTVPVGSFVGSMRIQVHDVVLQRDVVDRAVLIAIGLEVAARLVAITVGLPVQLHEHLSHQSCVLQLTFIGGVPSTGLKVLVINR